jgi:hypothetical protein
LRYRSCDAAARCRFATADEPQRAAIGSTENRLLLRVWRSSGEYRMKMPGSRRSTLIKRENAHQREATDADAAGFPSFCSSGDDGGNARHNAYLGTNAFGGRTGRQRQA